MYLLDTNAVSELRRAKKADRGVRMWARALPAASLYPCAISILELEIRILLIERRDRKQGAVRRSWMDGRVLTAHSLISDAFDQLAKAEPELAELVDWKFFCGFIFAEIAALRNLSERTVQRSWEKARIYLHHSIRADMPL
jgi:hypothetical protein